MWGLKSVGITSPADSARCHRSELNQISSVVLDRFYFSVIKAGSSVRRLGHAKAFQDSRVEKQGESCHSQFR